MATKIKDQDLEIFGLKTRVKSLKDKKRRHAEPTQEDAPITGGIIDIGEELRAKKIIELGSNDSEEMVNVLSSMEAANILSSGGAKDKGKEKMIETVVPKKRKLQEQIDAQVAREMEEEFARENQRSNEVITKHLIEYKQVEADLSIGEKIELIRELIDQGSSKRIKISEGASEEELKGMMQLVPLKEVYIEALQQFDREDVHQLWTLVKETFSTKHATRDKEKELWVELKRLFEPDFVDQLWTLHQAFMHDPLDWKLYDTCGVHHVST
nr:hypothetical protein [Tanacetum cinerariifolium]